MKGNKLMPQCGFSNNVVQILNSLGMSFDTFDVLSDMEIREGIKEFEALAQCRHPLPHTPFIEVARASDGLSREGRMVRSTLKGGQINPRRVDGVLYNTSYGYAQDVSGMQSRTRRPQRVQHPGLEGPGVRHRRRAIGDHATPASW